MGFREVRGIEFSPVLYEAARKTCARFQDRTGNSTKIKLFLADAIDIHSIGDEEVFFLFNPFDANTLKQLLKNIQVSIRQHPRRVWLIYHNPVHKHVIETFDDFVRAMELDVWGHDFAVYISDLNTV